MGNFEKRRFEWDPAKAKSNALKHGVTFEDALAVFEDPDSVELYDDDHSSPEEQRWIIIGKSEQAYLLTVVYALRGAHPHEKEIFRIISARHATPKERRRYSHGSHDA